MHRQGAVPRGEGLRALVRAICDNGGADTLIHETFECQLRHLTGAENHRTSPGERAENLSRQLQCRRAHRRGSAPD